MPRYNLRMDTSKRQYVKRNATKLANGLPRPSRMRRIPARLLDRMAREALRLGSIWAGIKELGYSHDAAQSILQDHGESIRARCAELRRAEAEAWAMGRAEIIRRLSGIVLADPSPILRGDPPETWPDDLRLAVQSLRLGRDGAIESVSFADRTAAARALAQANGWLSGDVQVHVTAMVGMHERLAAARARLSGALPESDPVRPPDLLPPLGTPGPGPKQSSAE